VARVGLVLGAGGTLGHAYHVGTLAALAEATGWDPRSADVVIGTSAGSIVASLLRSGFSAADLAAQSLGDRLSAKGQRLAELLGPPVALSPAASGAVGRGAGSTHLLRRAMLRPGSVRLGAAVAAALPPGQVPTELVVGGLRRLFGERWPDRPTWICAVRLDDGSRVVFGKPGAPAVTLAEAVAASCAIPSFFKPVDIAGQRYIDGGTHSVTNLDLAAGQGLDLVFVSSPMSARTDALRLGLDLPIRAATAARLAAEAAAVRRRGTDVIVFQPTAADRSAMGLNVLDARRQRAVTTQARSSALAWLDRPGARQQLRAVLSRS
jgi:NTE family protein